MWKYRRLGTTVRLNLESASEVILFVPVLANCVSFPSLLPEYGRKGSGIMRFTLMGWNFEAVLLG
jgi:hypothetical protein